MPIQDALGMRMKEYEAIAQSKLMQRTPVIIRVDGKAFHTFTRGLKRPWDAVLRKAMNTTMLRLAQNIQNCVFAYCQSDEISLICIDDYDINTSTWFDNKVQKIASVSAAMATLYFNQEFAKAAEDQFVWYKYSTTAQEEDNSKYVETLQKCLREGALFDARCFNVPKDEVVNNIYWRQVDAIRNSIQLCGQTYFSHKQLMNKNTKQVKEMLLNEKRIDWENMPIHLQRGVCCYKTEEGWTIDYNMPILKDEGRAFLEDIIN